MPWHVSAHPSPKSTVITFGQMPVTGGVIVMEGQESERTVSDFESPLLTNWSRIILALSAVLKTSS
jgi:hypothetical protein